MGHQKKILIAGVPEEKHAIFRKLLGKSGYSFSFSEINDCKLSESGLNPNIIIAALNNESELSEPDLDTLKASAEKEGIPFFVITEIMRKTTYLSLIEKGIYNIISAPVLKKNFLETLSDFTHCSSTDNLNITKIPLAFTCGSDNFNIALDEIKIAPLINSLLTNLENQIHFSRKNLKLTEKLKEEKKQTNARNNKEKGIEEFLWETLEQKNFRLFYQPVMHMKDNTLAGFEALIRIIDPERGIISPAEFIGTAENSAIIFPLGIWIIEEACRQISEWKKKFSFTRPVRININLSGSSGYRVETGIMSSPPK